MNLILLLHKFTPIYTICIREMNKSTISRNSREDKDLKSLKSYQIHTFSNIFENREGDTSLFIFVLHNLLIMRE